MITIHSYKQCIKQTQSVTTCILHILPDNHHIRCYPLHPSNKCTFVIPLISVIYSTKLLTIIPNPYVLFCPLRNKHKPIITIHFQEHHTTHISPKTPHSFPTRTHPLKHFIHSTTLNYRMKCVHPILGDTITADNYNFHQLTTTHWFHHLKLAPRPLYSLHSFQHNTTHLHLQYYSLSYAIPTICLDKLKNEHKQNNHK